MQLATIVSACELCPFTTRPDCSSCTVNTRLRVGAAGDRVDLVELQLRLMRIKLANGAEDRVDRAIAARRGRLLLAIDIKLEIGKSAARGCRPAPSGRRI